MQRLVLQAPLALEEKSAVLLAEVMADAEGKVWLQVAPETGSADYSPSEQVKLLSRKWLMLDHASPEAVELLEQIKLLDHG